MSKNSCCGGKIDVSNFGICKFCMTVAFISTIILWYSFFRIEWISYSSLKYLILWFAVPFTLASILHIIGYFTNKWNTIQNTKG